MKKSHILGIVIIAVAITVIISTAGDASSYVTFEEAYAQKDGGVHVVGQLKKDAKGHVVGIQPAENKLSFSFIMVDNDGEEQTVYYNEPMPNDFFRSEQVVVIGGYQGETFVADKILLKCPSKYQEEEVEI